MKSCGLNAKACELFMKWQAYSQKQIPDVTAFTTEIFYGKADEKFDNETFYMDA